MDYPSLLPEYADLWDTLTLHSNRRTQALAAANRILQHRQRYDGVARETGVPWFVIGLIHIMEADGDFDTHLHNGRHIVGLFDDLTLHRRSDMPCRTIPSPS